MVINFHHGHYLNFISNGGNLPNDIIPTINIYKHASKLTLALVQKTFCFSFAMLSRSKPGCINC